jgi:hypothetical protein
MWPDTTDTAVPPGPGTAAVSEDDLDYVRTRIPAVPVTRADGTVENLRTMAGRKPILLLAVSSGCAPCTPVIERIGVWRELLPEVDVRFLVATAPGNSSLIETDEPQSLHDPDGYARESLEAQSTPTAVLLGSDGMLAGGPVAGTDAVLALVDDIYESLHGERPPVAVTAPEQRG